VQRPVRTIVLNAIELDIRSAELRRDGAGGLTAQIACDAETERATLTFDEEIPAGPAELHLAFGGILNDKLRGFYRSTYRNDQGQERALATTQFESTDARRAFPCWDGPALKAVFASTLVTDPALVAVSNTAVREERADNGRKVVRFAETEGFEYDRHRPGAWRYRDYVVRCFAEDKPYDRFVEEQLAGDEVGANDPDCQIAAGFPISQPAISKHVKILEQSGLLDREVVGRVHRCMLDPKAMRAATTWLERQQRYWAAALDKLSAYLENSNNGDAGR